MSVWFCGVGGFDVSRGWRKDLNLGLGNFIQRK